MMQSLTHASVRDPRTTLPHCRPLSRPSPHTRRAPPPPRVAGQCYDAVCQAATDKAFVSAVLVPLAASAAAGVWFFTREAPPLPPDALMLDAKGDPVFRVAGWTPAPAPDGDAGTRLRIPVGRVGARAPRSFLFDRLLPTSRLLAVALPRPLGVTFAEDKRSGRVIVDELVEQGAAARRAAAAALDPILADTVLAPGDVLRAVTATTFVFRGPAALAGFTPPTREVVLFGADGERWPAVKAALRRGDVADGDVVVVVERPGAAAKEHGALGAAVGSARSGGSGGDRSLAPAKFASLRPLPDDGRGKVDL